MKEIKLLLFTLLIGLFSADASAAIATSADRNTYTLEAMTKSEKRMLKKERRAKKKSFRKALKKELKKNRSEVDFALVVVLTIFIPPLGVFLYEGDTTNRFWISLVLTLLFFIPGLIYSLIVVLGG